MEKYDIKPGCSNVTGEETSHLLPEALKCSAVGAVCVIKIAVSWMEHLCFKKEKTNLFLKILRC